MSSDVSTNPLEGWKSPQGLDLAETPFSAMARSSWNPQINAVNNPALTKEENKI